MIYGILHFFIWSSITARFLVYGEIKLKTLAQSKLLHRAKMNSLACQGLIN